MLLCHRRTAQCHASMDMPSRQQHHHDDGTRHASAKNTTTRVSARVLCPSGAADRSASSLPASGAGRSAESGRLLGVLNARAAVVVFVYRAGRSWPADRTRPGGGHRADGTGRPAASFDGSSTLLRGAAVRLISRVSYSWGGDSRGTAPSSPVDAKALPNGRPIRTTNPALFSRAVVEQLRATCVAACLRPA